MSTSHGHQTSLSLDPTFSATQPRIILGRKAYTQAVLVHVVGIIIVIGLLALEAYIIALSHLMCKAFVRMRFCTVFAFAYLCRLLSDQSCVTLLGGGTLRGCTHVQFIVMCQLCPCTYGPDMMSITICSV